jgi:hypothetical protein
MARAARTRQEHPDLAVLDPACRPGILSRHADRVLALLEKTCFIDHQHGSFIAKRFNNIATYLVAQCIAIRERDQEDEKNQRPVGTNQYSEPLYNQEHVIQAQAPTGTSIEAALRRRRDGRRFRCSRKARQMGPFAEGEKAKLI